MKNFLSIILFTTTAVFFSACGGGGGDASFENATVDITVACTTTPTATDIATYHELLSGDTIVKDQAGTIVQIYSPVGQNQRVCLENGAAHIVRK